MTEPGPAAVGIASSQPKPLLSSLAATSSDPSGSDTFASYVWQAKQAVRLWLTCLLPDGPLLVVCEHVEDVVAVFPDRLRFSQLKTRRRGSWSASAMCDSGLDSLCRSYAAAKDADILEVSGFELWLEGPIAPKSDTVKFVANPTTATEAIRKKLLDNGAEDEWLDDFLSKLSIKADQPAQSFIDAIVVREISCIWPSLSKPELDSLYLRLLQEAQAAQSAGNCPSFMSQLAQDSDMLPGLGSLQIAGSGESTPIEAKLLRSLALRLLAPPLPNDVPEIILERIGEGSESSMLEMKMRIAGGSDRTVSKAQQLRASMEIRRQKLLAASDGAEERLERLAERVLTTANAVADRIQLSAVANPVASARPAEAIAAELLSDLGNLGSLDTERLFAQDGLDVYGFLGHLSDGCRYGWRSNPT